MKRLLGFGVLGVVGFSVSFANAAQPAKIVSPTKLAAMGLPGLRQLSQAEGQTVRGQGVFVSGFSHAGSTTNVGVPVTFPNGAFQFSSASSGGNFLGRTGF